MTLDICHKLEVLKGKVLGGAEKVVEIEVAAV
jgi:hypothetical protein